MRRAAATAGTTIALLALAGCGGGTKTVTVSSAPAPTASTSTSTRTASTGASKRAHGTSTAVTSTAPATPTTTAPVAGSTTRTAPEPAFTQHGGTGAEEATGAEAAAAIATVKARGYTPNDTSEYHPNQTLRVLTATRTGSADGYDQRAFFFVDDRYIGTDSSQPSASVRVVAQSDTEVVLAYPLYRSSDPLCCPGGGQATVHFQLDDGQLVPLQPIPPASSTTGLSRQ